MNDERRAILQETTDALRQAGLSHIIAISGLNMALSAGIFFVGFRALLSLFRAIAQAYPVKKIAAGGALLALTAYYMTSGFAVSAERAFIMMAVMLIAVLFDRPSISLCNIAISALLIVAMSPSEALGPSFQMSYAATLALVAGYALWSQRPMRESAFLKLPVMKPVVVAGRFFGGILLTSMIGGFSTALFSIEHFQRLTAYSLPANLMAMPFISFVIMPMGMIAMLLTPFGLDAIFLKVAGVVVDIVIAIAKLVAGWGGNIGIGRLPAWYFPAAVAGFLILTLLRTRVRHLGTAVMAISTPAVAWSLPRLRPIASFPKMAVWLRSFTVPPLRPTANVRPTLFLINGKGRWFCQNISHPASSTPSMFRSRKRAAEDWCFRRNSNATHAVKCDARQGPVRKTTFPASRRPGARQNSTAVMF